MRILVDAVMLHVSVHTYRRNSNYEQSLEQPEYLCACIEKGRGASPYRTGQDRTGQDKEV